MVRFIEECIDRSTETFRHTRNSLFTQIILDGGDEIRNRVVLYKCLSELYAVGNLTARRYKEIYNKVYEKHICWYTPLDDVTGWDLRYQKVRSYG